MPSILQRFEAHLSDLRSPRTVREYACVVRAFFTSWATPDCPPAPAVVESFLTRPKRGDGRRAASTRNHELQALRAFAAFAKRDLAWTTDPTAELRYARATAREPAVLTAAEVRRLFSIAAERSRPAERARNLAILAVLTQTALRVHELVALDVAQVDLETGTLLGVHGKGGSVHDVPLNDAARSLLATWTAERGDSSDRALFLSSWGTRLSVRTVQRLVARLREGVTPKPMTPHTLRHTAGTLGLVYGSDLSSVSEFLRHTSLASTQRYLHLVDERRREVARRLAVTVPREILGPNPAKNGAGGAMQKGVDANYPMDDAA